MWSDERITERAIANGNPECDNMTLLAMFWQEIAFEIRDEMQQRIAELEAENAKLRALLAKELRDEDVVSLILESSDALLKGVAEIQHLRALLPGPEVRAVFNELLADARLSPFHEANRYDLDTVRTWLDRVTVAQRMDELEAAGELDSEAHSG